MSNLNINFWDRLITIQMLRWEIFAFLSTLAERPTEAPPFTNMLNFNPSIDK